MKSFMMKLLAAALFISMMVLPMSGLAVDYPLDTDETLTMWRVYDSGITEAGFTTGSEIPAILAWQEQTGIKLDMREFIDDNALLMAVMTADELPDILMINRDKYPGGVSGLAEDGIVTEITKEEFAAYAPDYWEYIDKPIYLDSLVQLDGKMYNFSGHIFEPNSPYRYYTAIFYRGDLLDKVGKSVPTTIDEFYDVLVALKDLEGIEYPWVLQAPTVMRDSFNNGIYTSPFGIVRADEYQVDGVWHLGAAEEGYADLLRFVHQMYVEGMISPDYLSMETSQAQAMIINGQAGVFVGGVGRIGVYSPLLQEGEYLVAGPCLRADDAERSMWSFADTYVTWGNACYLTPDCKDRELALNFLNYVYTPEGNLLRNFGIEGETYYVDEDGVTKYTEFMTNNPDGYGIEGLTRSYALLSYPGIHADFQQEQRQALPAQVEAFKVWANSDHDKYEVTHSEVLPEYATEYANLWTDISLYIDECRAKFISGEMDVDTDFDTYLETLDTLGFQRVREIKQATLDVFNNREL